MQAEPVKDLMPFLFRYSPAILQFVKSCLRYHFTLSPENCFRRSIRWLS